MADGWSCQSGLRLTADSRSSPLAAMRILLVSHRADDRAAGGRLDTWAGAMALRGHQVSVVAPGDPSAPGGPSAPGVRRVVPRFDRDAAGSMRAELELAGRAATEAIRKRPQVAVVAWERVTQAVPRVLHRLGVRVVLAVGPEALPAGEGGRDEAVRTWMRAAAQRAGAIVTFDRDAHERLRDQLHIRGAHLLEEGLDLHRFLPAEPQAAQRTLGLPRHRYVALTGRLDPELRLDLLALAHRKLPGVGLLVAAEGPAEGALEAMRLATRPSSPVIRLEPEPEAERLAIAAAELGLALRPQGVGPESLAYAAMGRRQVALSEEVSARIAPLFPGGGAVVRPPARDPSPADLQRALEAALEQARAGPLPGLDGARQQLGTGSGVDRLLEVAAACAAE